jgi:hypothetical protein
MADAQQNRPPLTLTSLPDEIQILILSEACEYEFTIQPRLRNGHNPFQGVVSSVSTPEAT